ncbi:MFS transporter [Naasia sp. SYSU D00057]|uniref:MFS transporter n=1 Tax=Naasia sp. SYSU D00057 TaxID=2817380 RepID=UPI001B312D6F|nr:MFS transporter [Naasia sp. SYSU D00057]
MTGDVPAVPMPARITPFRLFAGLARWDYYPIAFLGRLPFAMTTVGVLALVVGVRGSVAEAGLASAAAGVATAVSGPLLGREADRRGQRGVLLACSAVTVVALVLLLALVYSSAPVGAVALAALLLGGAVPQVGPFSRSRMARYASIVPGGESRRAMSLVMSYESIADEASFVLGPVLVGVLATLGGAWAPFAVAAVLAAIFPVAFALHPSGAFEPHAAMPGAAPRGSVLSVRVLLLVPAMALVGGVFGATLTGLTGFLGDRGAESQTGTVYGAMSVGSILVAFGVAALPQRFALPGRWLAFGGVAIAGLSALTLAGGVGTAVLSLFLAGCGVGAVLVTLFSLGTAAAPHGRTTMVVTMLQSALTVGQALVIAGAGAAVEAGGPTAGFLLALGCAALVTLLAVAYLIRFRR